MNENKKPKIVIFLTVFIYLLGFGMIIPIIPLISVQYGASAFQTGLLLSIYSFMQFVFSPVWGRLSDRFGRRPILLICLAGEVVAYIIFGLSRSIEMLFLARCLSGFFGASISTASAYISDITPTHERSKGMALIGAAFGLGFLFGPAIGGGLTIWAKKLSPDPAFTASFAAYWVSILCLATFIFAYFNLKETLNKDLVQKKLSRWKSITKFISAPVVGPLVFVFFLSSFAMSSMEATLVLFMKDKFSWGLTEISFGFAYVGLMIVITQGFLVRRLIPRFGERNILRLGLIFMAIGLGGIAFANSLFFLALTQTFLALGIGFTNPSTLGSISLLTDASEQGAAMGTTQSMASLGRILGPALGGAVYGAWNPESPFLISCSLIFLALFVVASIFKQIPIAGMTAKINPGSMHAQ